MISKTKDFQFNEETTFKNEIIHFFNIDALDSILYIYLEIEGNRIKSEKTQKNYYKINLKEDSIQNVKKEMNCIIIEDVELTIVIRVISDYIKYFRKKSRSFHKKSEKWERTEDRKKTVQTTLIHVMTINEKILLFSGKLIRRQLQNKIIPGRLKVPKIFQIESEPENKK